MKEYLKMQQLTAGRAEKIYNTAKDTAVMVLDRTYHIESFRMHTIKDSIESNILERRTLHGKSRTAITASFTYNIVSEEIKIKTNYAETIKNLKHYTNVATLLINELKRKLAM